VFPKWNSDTLIWKEVTQFRENESVDWQDQFRTMHRYDGEGRLIYQQDWSYFSDLVEWRIDVEKTYQYDIKGRIILYIHRNWDSDLDKLYSEYYTKHIYKNDALTEISRNWIYFERNTRSEEIYNYYYDANGNQVRQEVAWNSYTGDVLTDQQGARRFDYYDPNSCAIAMANYRLENDQWIKEDSTYYTRNPQCEITQYASYTGYYDQWIFHREEHWEKLYDDSGNLIEYNRYVKRGIIWDLIYQQVCEYKDNGGLTKTEKDFTDSICTRGTRFTYDYDVEGRIVSILNESYNLIDESWEISYQETIEYDIHDNITLFERLSPGFQFVRNEYEYDNYQNLVSDEYIQVNVNPDSTDTFTFRKKVTYDYRCDNLLMNKMETVLENTENSSYFPKPPFKEGNQLRTTTSYYSLDPCQDADSKSGITLFPNPALDYITVLSEEILGNTRLQLMDNLGRIVFRQRGNFSNYFHVDLVTVDPGTYLLQMESESLNYSNKLIIVK
jgi:hypothetical protein